MMSLCNKFVKEMHRSSAASILEFFGCWSRWSGVGLFLEDAGAGGTGRRPLLVRGLHLLQTSDTCQIVVANGQRIVHTNDTACFHLHIFWSFPRLKDVGGREILQLWQVFFNVSTRFVVFLSKRNRRINAKVLVEEGRSTNQRK